MAPHQSNPTGGAITFNPYKIRGSPFYSHVGQSDGPSNIVITAGQIGARPDGTVPSDIDEQIQQAFINLGRCLEAAGARVEDILKVTYYIVDYDPKNTRHRAPLLQFLGSHRPGKFPWIQSTCETCSVTFDII